LQQLHVSVLRLVGPTELDVEILLYTIDVLFDLSEVVVRVFMGAFAVIALLLQVRVQLQYFLIDVIKSGPPFLLFLSAFHWIF
jgi:hypothetical protein